jgi:SAM-dependent methyltransferase
MQNFASARTATDEFYRTGGFSYTEEHVSEWISSHVTLPRQGRVLDLCCGDGIWSRGFQLVAPNLDLYGIDISTGAIETACELLGATSSFVVGDAEAELPWPDCHFDLVFARGPGLYNQHDMTRANTVSVIEKWHQKLKPDGRFYSIFASNPRRMGSYTPPENVKLPYNKTPRSTPAVQFDGGKFHHSIESFHAPFLAANSVEIERYSFVGNMHILITRSTVE